MLDVKPTMGDFGSVKWWGRVHSRKQNHIKKDTKQNAHVRNLTSVN